MSLKSIFASVAHAVGLGTTAASATVSTAALASLNQLGNSLAGSLAVAADQSGPIGAAIEAAIQASDAAAANDPNMSSRDKLTRAIAAVGPVVVTEAAKVGISGVEAEADRFAEMAIENRLSILRQTPLAKLAAALLHDIGINV